MCICMNMYPHLCSPATAEFMVKKICSFTRQERVPSSAFCAELGCLGAIGPRMQASRIEDIHATLN